MSTTTQLQTWLNGTVNGGPNSDGRYPMTARDGVVFLVYCPAAQALNPALSEQPVEIFSQQASSAASSASISATAANTDRIAAAASAANAASSASAALSSRNAAVTNATNAAASQGAAGTSATNAASSNTSAGTARTAAETARDKAQQWADEAVDFVVASGKYSAKHWAQKAADSVASLSAPGIADVTGLVAALAAKLETSAFNWSGLAGKPTTFTPTAHSHAQSDITGLVASLAAKQDASTAWNTGNFTPASYLPLAGGTVAGTLAMASTNQITFFSANYRIFASNGLEFHSFDHHRWLIGGTERMRLSATSVTLAGDVSSTGAYRSTGDNSGAGFAGPGVELYMPVNSEGYLLPYNRTTNAWLPMRIYGNPVRFYVSGTLIATLNASAFLVPAITLDNSVGASLVGNGGGTQCNANYYVVGTSFLLNALSTAWVRQPRTFVQSGDPGTAAADGDLWFW